VANELILVVEDNDKNRKLVEETTIKKEFGGTSHPSPEWKVMQAAGLLFPKQAHRLKRKCWRRT
jgi:hypothetical protein